MMQIEKRPTEKQRHNKPPLPRALQKQTSFDVDSLKLSRIRSQSSQSANIGVTGRRTLLQKINKFKRNLLKKTQPEVSEKSERSQVQSQDILDQLMQEVVAQSEIAAAKLEAKQQAMRSSQQNEIRYTKSVLLKKLHTQEKMDHLQSKKFGQKFYQTGGLGLKATKRSASVLQLMKPNNKDILLDEDNKQIESTKDPLDIRLGTITEFNTLPIEGNTSSQLFDEKEVKVTARRATVKILNRLDKLMKDRKFQLARMKKPRFDFNDKKMENQLCDTEINEDTTAFEAVQKKKEDNVQKVTDDVSVSTGRASCSSRRTNLSERVAKGLRKMAQFEKQRDYWRNFNQFCNEVEAAYAIEDVSENEEQGEFGETAYQVQSSRWWPTKCFRQDEIRSSPMTKKNLRNIGFLSHSNLPPVDSDLNPLIHIEDINNNSPLRKKVKMPLLTLSKSSNARTITEKEKRFETEAEADCDDSFERSTQIITLQNINQTDQPQTPLKKLNTQQIKYQKSLDKDRFIQKTLSKAMATKYPRNQFQINLPSLEAIQRAEKRKNKQRGILKESQIRLKQLDSDKRQELTDKITEYKKQNELAKQIAKRKESYSKLPGTLGTQLGNAAFKSVSMGVLTKTFDHFNDLQMLERNRLNDEMVKNNKSLSRQFSVGQHMKQRLKKNSGQDEYDEVDKYNQEDSIDEVLQKMNKLPIEKTTILAVQKVEARLKKKKAEILKDPDRAIYEVGQVMQKFVPVVHKMELPKDENEKKRPISQQEQQNQNHSKSPEKEKWRRTTGPFRLRHNKCDTLVYTRMVPQEIKKQILKSASQKNDFLAPPKRMNLLNRKSGTAKVVKLKRDPSGADQVEGQTNTSIFDCDGYDLRRSQEDLYKRVSKTVNIDYDAKQVKPFLKELAKKDQQAQVRPLGLANEAHFPAELRAQFYQQLNPLAQDVPEMYALIGGTTKNRTDKAFFRSELL